MSVSQQTVRILISSPGDVVDEREQARRVIRGLQRGYPGITLEPMLWEEFALPATASFQETIDDLLERQPIDMAIFILWSRLGSPLGPVVTRPDGSPYRSGTEREFDLMITAFAEGDGLCPVILAYERIDDPSFDQKLVSMSGSALEELITQRKLVKAFIHEQFYDAAGHNIRAIHNYYEPVGFAQRLRIHLRDALSNLLGADAAPRWLDDPYRGLKVFDTQHAEIFHGRDEETCDLLQRLRDQQRLGCAFAVIVGASGSGKSSLAHAGVAASLEQHAGDDDVKEWRKAVIIPVIRGCSEDTSDDGGRALCSLLTETICGVLPELASWSNTLDDPKTDPSVRVHEIIAFLAATNEQESNDEAAQSTTLRVLLVLDQMEELWTDRRITDEARKRFLDDVKLLARCGTVAVLATLRSDFYPHAQQLETFLQLKGERGHFDLLPPGPAALGRVITEPARLAGLRFESDQETGRSLDELILEHATRDPTALPLLQYTLDELYRQRDESNQQLTFAAYDKLGGVEGSLGLRAEELLEHLPPDTRAAFSDILSLLITVDDDADNANGDQSAVRRRARLHDLTATPEQATLTNALIAGRFLIADRKDDSAIVSLAHEALLRRWDRIVRWITVNRAHLRLRARVEQKQQQWEQQHRDDSLLLPAGLPLEEARQLLTDAPNLLSRATNEFVVRSLDHHASLARRILRRRRMFTTALSVATLIAILGVIRSVSKQHEAESATGRADREAAAAISNADDARANLKIAERNAYNSDMLLAQRDWDTANMGHLRQVLDSYRARDDLKRFEWGYWNRMAHGDVLTLEGHTDDVLCVAISPDGTRLASGGWDDTVILWDTTTGQLVHSLKEHNGRVKSVAFSPDGTQLASAGEDGKVLVWSIATTQTTHSFFHSQGTSVSFSPDGMRLASGGEDRKARIRDLSTGQTTLTLDHSHVVESVTFSPDGMQLATASRVQGVKVWDAVTGEELRTFEHPALVESIAFSPDGTRLASAGRDNKVRIWDAATGRETLELIGHTDLIESVSFSQDGRRLASASWDNTIKVWDLSTGQETFTFRGHSSEVYSVVFSPNGTRLVSASLDKTVKVWDATRARLPLALTSHTDDVVSVSFSPDGTRLASASYDRSVKIWDVATGEVTLTLSGHVHNVYSVTFAPNGATLASTSGRYLESGQIKVWDALTGREKYTLKGHASNVTSVAFNSDGNSLASSSSDLTVKLWDVVAARETMTLEGHTEPVTSVAFKPDAMQLASASEDDLIKIWDTATGHELFTLKGHMDDVLSVAFSPDGTRLASACWDGTVKVWDMATRQEEREFLGHTGLVLSVAFSPDGSRLASAGADKMVRIWDVDAGQETLTLKDHTEIVWGLAFSPDGSRLASASADDTVNVWDARPWTRESRAESQARGLLTAHRDRVDSLEGLQTIIRSDQTIDDTVRKQALDWAKLFWDNRQIGHAE